MATLTPHLGTVDQVYQKVLRERYRTWHAKDFIHRADHFYNFCITAHSLRDYFIEHKGWGGSRKNMRRYCGERTRQYAAWDSNELLRAVGEIANSAKHFSLRNPPQTKGTEETTAPIVEVYVEGDELRCVEAVIPDFVVTMAAGDEYPLLEIMSDVSEYWLKFLKADGLRVGDDPHYFGDSTK